MSRMNMLRLCGAAIALLVFAGPARASTIWTLDQAQSYVSLALPPQSVSIPIDESNNLNLDVRTVSQNPSNGKGSGSSWTTGSKAFYTGSISTNYSEGSSITFNSGLSSITGVQGIVGYPNPANFVQDPAKSAGEGKFTGTNGGSAAAAYALTVQSKGILGNYSDIGPAVISNISLDLLSGTIPLSGTPGNSSFAATGVTMGIDNADLSLNITNIVISIGLGFTGVQTSFDYAGQALTGGSGTITSPDPINTPLLRKLTIPINVAIAIDEGSFTLVGSATGQFVAYAMVEVVPEPGSILLAMTGVVGLGAICWRKKVARARR